MNSVKIVEEIKKRLKTYKFSKMIMEAYHLSPTWQDEIPDFIIQIIVEQTQNILREQKEG
jgi:hypothetical protein